MYNSIIKKSMWRKYNEKKKSISSENRRKSNHQYRNGERKYIWKKAIEERRKEEKISGEKKIEIEIYNK